MTETTNEELDNWLHVNERKIEEIDGGCRMLSEIRARLSALSQAVPGQVVEMAEHDFRKLRDRVSKSATERHPMMVMELIAACIDADSDLEKLAPYRPKETPE